MGRTQQLPQELPVLHKKDLVQDSLDWEKAKDGVEKRAGIKSYCSLCRMDSHTEAQCVAARTQHASKRKVLMERTVSQVTLPSGRRKILKSSGVTLTRSWSRGGTLMTFSM